ncbi:hypothetical protein ANCDUO_21743 [Ancylostoma duodenale]|uniref:Uncharacterized protein n=1 Tax=Ancylostoma duodenale TaxID=51022 RepID=A0A0C2FTF3_9BILA|nr:hypothetical protein ANCDUO_21743 [Ancylostoma duodenale]
MSVETWRNGNAQDVGSQCSKNKVHDVGITMLSETLYCYYIKVYDVEEVNLLGKPFPSSKDHSKWGVSMNVDKPAVCIGDVNRQVSQFNRGGGAVCIEDKKLWQAFHGSVAKYEKCGKT